MHTDRTQGPKRNSIERTLHLRVRDKQAGFLLEQSRWVNFVWNYDNELSWKGGRRSVFDPDLFSVLSTLRPQRYRRPWNKRVDVCGVRNGP